MHSAQPSCGFHTKTQAEIIRYESSVPHHAFGKSEDLMAGQFVILMAKKW